MISAKDKAQLRETAKKYADLAFGERNERLHKDWMAHGSAVDSRPMVKIEIETFEHEMWEHVKHCEGEEAFGLEKRLLRPLINFEKFKDDTVLPKYWGVGDQAWMTPFGLPVKRQESGDLGHHFVPYLRDLEEDEHLLGDSVLHFHEENAAKEMERMHDLIGDILPIQRVSGCAYSVPMQDIVHIMNMDDMYMAMIDEPERFDRMLGRLVDDYLKLFRMQESAGTYHSHARAQSLGQGTYCFTDELEDGKAGAGLKDMWLFMDAQETAGISPAMYEEMVFPHYKRLMDQFGLVSYGCCEAVHPIWENCLSKVKNLRRVSISPWCDEEYMGEALKGTRVIYARKPPATILGMDTPTLDEAVAVETFRKTKEAAKGCKLEIVQRDVYRVGHSVEKVRRFVELARGVLEG